MKKHGFIDADDLETPSSPPMRGYAGLLREPAGYADVDDAGGVEGRVSVLDAAPRAKRRGSRCTPR